MGEKSEWENLSSEKRLDLTKLSRALIRGSIIEDAATRFMAMCIAEAVAKQKAKTADEIEALRAENERYREAGAACMEALKYMQSFGCPVCQGGCEGETPPMPRCPVREVAEAIGAMRAARARNEKAPDAE